ncbi:MAG TPA: hypothetical protein EYG11_09815 [Candidatus Latescibacteria bacterium]|nr:hypothetical protein [Candidatus Handelsmanbacteria bacterium]HIL08984.1 hypothetical protein [Candidatus Latescibacterota bacterium]
MILTAHQSKYLPWLGLFHKMALATHYVHFDQVQYQKKNFLNKNYIKGVNGQPLRLTVPVKTSGRFEQRIVETGIDNTVPWARKHWKSMRLAYAKAPHFKRHEDFFADAYAREWELLVDLNRHMLEYILAELGIEVEHVEMHEGEFAGKGNGLVLDMCEKMGAELYIFGAGGRDYAQEEDFRAAGIELCFQEYVHPEYPQLHGEFIAGSSIVDLLFNCGDNSLDILMEGNIAKAVAQPTVVGN